MDVPTECPAVLLPFPLKSDAQSRIVMSLRKARVLEHKHLPLKIDFVGGCSIYNLNCDLFFCPFALSVEKSITVQHFAAKKRLEAFC